MKRRPTLERLLPQNPETRRMVFVAAGLFLGSAVVTLIIVLSTGSLGTGRTPPPAVPGETAQTDGSVRIGLSDLILPSTAPFGPPSTAPLAQSPGFSGSGSREEVRDLREAQASGQAPPYLLREPIDRWSDQQVQRYWIPLDKIAVDLIRKENDRRMRALFEGVP